MGVMKGCNDHGCLVAKPAGMGTNGGCRCPVWKLHATIARVRADNERLKAEMDEAEKTLLLENRLFEENERFKGLLKKIQSAGVWYHSAFEIDICEKDPDTGEHWDGEKLGEEIRRALEE